MPKKLYLKKKRNKNNRINIDKEIKGKENIEININEGIKEIEDFKNNFIIGNLKVYKYNLKQRIINSYENIIKFKKSKELKMKKK